MLAEMSREIHHHLFSLVRSNLGLYPPFPLTSLIYVSLFRQARIQYSSNLSYITSFSNNEYRSQHSEMVGSYIVALQLCMSTVTTISTVTSFQKLTIDHRYGMLSSPNMKEVADKYQWVQYSESLYPRYWHHDLVPCLVPTVLIPSFSGSTRVDARLAFGILIFFGPQTLIQLYWLYKLYMKPNTKESEDSDAVRYAPFFVLGNICIGIWMSTLHLDP